MSVFSDSWLGSIVGVSLDVMPGEKLWDYYANDVLIMTNMFFNLYPSHMEHS